MKIAPSVTTTTAQFPLGPISHPSPPQKVDQAKIDKAASDFEAMVVGQFLEPIFSSVDTTNSAFGGGAGEEAWKPMLIQALAVKITAHGGLGLATPIRNELLNMQKKHLDGQK